MTVLPQMTCLRCFAGIALAASAPFAYASGESAGAGLLESGLAVLVLTVAAGVVMRLFRKSLLGTRVAVLTTILGSCMLVLLIVPVVYQACQREALSRIEQYAALQMELNRGMDVLVKEQGNSSTATVRRLTELLSKAEADFSTPVFGEQYQRPLSAEEQEVQLSLQLLGAALAEHGEANLKPEEISAGRGELVIRHVEADLALVRASERVLNEIALSNDRASNMMLVLGLGFLGLVLFTVNLFYRSLLETLGSDPREFGMLLNQLKEGNLQAPLPHSGPGGLVNQLSAVLDSIRALLVDMKDSAGDVARESQDVGTAAGELVGRTRQQAAAFEEIAASIEEISETIALNSRNASIARQIAGEAHTIASEGERVVSDVSCAMADIDQASKQIVDITSVLSEIAFKTNLLAINAAVEAARAGEKGSGFAVVAGEVRSLARRSASAADDIKDLIEDTLLKIERGTKLVRDSGSTLDAIVEKSRRTDGCVAEIADGCREQADSIERINASILRIEQELLQNLAVVEDLAQSCDSLVTRACDLEDGFSSYVAGDMRQGSGSSFDDESEAGFAGERPDRPTLRLITSENNDMEPAVNGAENA